MYKFDKEHLQRVDPELREDLLVRSRRRTAAQRRSGDSAVAIIPEVK
jgi:hypothetical protein